MGHLWRVTHYSLSTDTRSPWEMESLMDFMRVCQVWTDSMLSCFQLSTEAFPGYLWPTGNGVTLKNTELCLSRLAPCQDSHLLQLRQATSYLSVLALTLVLEPFAALAGSSTLHMALLVWEPDSDLVNSQVGLGRSWSRCVGFAQNEQSVLFCCSQSVLLFSFILHLSVSWKNGHSPQNILSAKVILKENIMSHFLRALCLHCGITYKMPRRKGSLELR